MHPFLTQIKSPAPACVHAFDALKHVRALPLKTEPIAETWDALDNRQSQFIGVFYDRLFERFPAYRKFFPRKLDAEHLDKMALTVALVARFADDEALIAPHLHKVGAAHRPYDLTPRDMQNFAAVFVEVLGEHLGDRWTEAAARAWLDAFERVIIPLLLEGERSTA